MGRQFLQRTIFLGLLYLMFIAFQGSPGCFQKYKDIFRIFRNIKSLGQFRTESKDIKPNQNRLLKMYDKTDDGEDEKMHDNFSKIESKTSGSTTILDNIVKILDDMDKNDQAFLKEDNFLLQTDYYDYEKVQDNLVSSSVHEVNDRDEEMEKLRLSIKNNVQEIKEISKTMKDEVALFGKEVEKISTAGLKRDEEQELSQQLNQITNDINQFINKKDQLIQEEKEVLASINHKWDQHQREAEKFSQRFRILKNTMEKLYKK